MTKFTVMPALMALFAAARRRENVRLHQQGPGRRTVFSHARWIARQRERDQRQRRDYYRGTK